MKRKIAALGLIGGLWASTMAVAATPDTARENRLNAEAERGYLHMAFELGDGDGAYRRYARPDFIQHNPSMADGVEARIAYLRHREHEGAGEPPQEAWLNIVQNVVMDGNLLVVHHHVYRSPDDPGRMFVDVWRFEHGRIAEHWDMIRQVPADAINPMWCGGYRNYQEAKVFKGGTVSNPACGPLDPHANRAASIAVVRNYIFMLSHGHAREAVIRYLSDDYQQHSAMIPPGKAGALEALPKEQDPTKPRGPDTLINLAAAHDLVIYHRHVVRPGGEETVQADIFRVRGGKITAHWDVKQRVESKTASGHPMW